MQHMLKAVMRAQQVAAYLSSGEHHHADTAASVVGNKEQGQPWRAVMNVTHGHDSVCLQKVWAGKYSHGSVGVASGLQHH